jgi:serine/threonine protein kinase
MTAVRAGEETVSVEVTHKGAVLGTPAYLSPEQARGEPLDARSDLFAFGIVLYEMATGRQPFRGSTPAELWGAVLHVAPEPAGSLRPDLPAELDRMISTALEKDRALRFQTAVEMKAALKRVRREMDSAVFPRPAPIRTRRWPALAAAAGVALAAAGAWWLAQSWRAAPPASAQYVQLTQFPDSVHSPALSPDGRMLAFVRGRDTFLGEGQVTSRSCRTESPRLSRPTLEPRWRRCFPGTAPASPTRPGSEALGLPAGPPGRCPFSEEAPAS